MTALVKDGTRHHLKECGSGLAGAPAGVMATVWIVHREARHRAMLARMAGAGVRAVAGGPSDPVFDSAEAPDVVLLGLAGDFEAELEFVHRHLRATRQATMVLLAGAADRAEARRLFDTVPGPILRDPPRPDELRRTLRQAVQRRRADPLSRRRGRDALAARFARWFADLDLPELLRALDPQLTRVPLLIRGEPGTGRALVARYVYAFGGVEDAAFLHAVCEPEMRTSDLLQQLSASSDATFAPVATIWLEDVDLLPPSVQRQVQDWIEFSPPEGALRTPVSRWIATADDAYDPFDDSGLDPRLAQTLAGLEVRIPPLRERPNAVESFVADTALAWCNAQGQRLRRFDPEALEALTQMTWPGNLRELEGVVARTLASSASDPLRLADLRLDGGEAPPSGERPAGVPSTEPAPATPAELPAPVPRPFEEAPRTPVDVRPAPAAEDTWRRLVGAVAHEVRNPLVSIRTFAELLPERFEDEEFRRRFADLVGSDVRRIEDVVTRLGEVSKPTEGRPESVDMAGLLETLLDEQRDRIQQRRLLVLKELDRTQPFVVGEPDRIQAAFRGLLSKALEFVPERGDLYLASKHHASGLRGDPTVRVLVRFHHPQAETDAAAGVHVSETALEFVVAEAIVRSQGGTLTVDTTDAQESVVVVDLPAPR
ncbi:MAG: hypothetical protein MJE66_12120 [Proteobacteria bacterium]|nr:hypothetical protein [Pseudomonadota bacterium]